MANERNGPIEVSSSPEPVSIQTHARAKVDPTVSVIELSDSDDEWPATRRKPALNAVAGPSSRRRPQKLGSSSSAQNIPKKPTPSRAAPFFLQSDEENEPPNAQPARTLTPAPFPFKPEADRPPTPPAQSQPLPAPDPHSTVTARVLEIIPDVDPDYLLAAVSKHIIDHSDQNIDLVIEYILHALFEDNKYPKVDRNTKGKRKQIEQGEATLSKKSKIDYANKDRPFKGGKHYTKLALEHLQIAFPFIPTAYLRQILATHNGLYAPAHIFLVEQELSHEQRETGEKNHPPYVKRATPFRPKGKGAAAQDEELEAERKWLLEYLQRRGENVMQGADNVEDDGTCEDGIECGCCFSTYRFDKMIQCPETHLFCTTCMRSYASNLLGTHDINIKCMDQSGCKALIPYSELKRFLPEKLMTLYERVKQRKEVEAAGLEGLEECPFCEWRCVIENSEEKLLRCGNVDACGAVSCRQCKKLDHLPRSCKEMEDEKHLDGRHAVEEAMTQALMRNCPKCQKPFIKESGCNKMTCPDCRTLSCYICRQVIRGYDHFNPEPGRDGTSDNPNAGKCLLWDSVEQRHVDEVKAAAERAQAEYRRENPDVTDEALKVDLPVVPPPVNGPGAREAQVLRNAEAALRRAQADLAAREAEERAHRTAMDVIHAELQCLEGLRKAPGMQEEYDKQAGPRRADYSRENTRWYQARGLVAEAYLRVRHANAEVQHAQVMHAQAHVHHHGAFGFGMGGLANDLGGAVAPPHMRVPAVPAGVRRPRPRAQRR